MDIVDLVRAIGAFAVTMGLLLGAAWLARKYGLMQGQITTSSPKRLRLVEQIWLDAGKTRAVILRCDGVDHLLVLSPQGAHQIAQCPAIEPPPPAPNTDT